MNPIKIIDLHDALKAGSKIANMFGLKGIERTASINNFAYQITGINAMEMLGFKCKVESKFKNPLPQPLDLLPLPND